MAFFHNARAIAHAQKMYERYKEEWLSENITADIITQTMAAYENDPDVNFDTTFKEYVEKYGYADGSCYYLFDEFLDKEYPIWSLAEKLEQYMYERGEYEYPKYDWLDWLDKDGIREGSEAEIRDMLVSDPKRLYEYIRGDSSGLSADDELCSTAKSLMEKVSKYCSETSKKDKTAVERD